MRLLILGNSGAGKTTLARELADEHDLVHFDLDTVAFEPEPVGQLRPDADVRADLERFAGAHDAWVAEGSQANLVRMLSHHATGFVWLNPGIDVCLRHHAARPWEPHKYDDPAEQEKHREFLEGWVRQYPTRDDQFGERAHRAGRDSFHGPSIEARDNAEAHVFARRQALPGDAWSDGEVRIRLGTAADIPAIARLLADPDVCTWLWFGPLDEQGANAYFRPIFDAQAAAVERGALADVVELIVDVAGEFAGHAACVRVEGSPDTVEIGYALSRAVWGKGVGSRVGAFLAAFALDVLGARRLEANCLAGNAGSRRILERLGLRQEGVRRGLRVVRGEAHDEVLYGVLAAELDRSEIDRLAGPFLGR